MKGKLLSHEAATRLMELARSSYRPPEILKLQEEIESAKRVAALHASISGEVNHEEVEEIVRLRRELDGLYTAWAEGKLS